MSTDGGWVALFSGGKESAWALHRALETGHEVRRLAIVHPPASSHMYHAPAGAVARLAARSIGIPILDVGLPVVDLDSPDIVQAEDDAAFEPLDAALRTLDAELDGGVAGVVAGTVGSEFQAGRLRSMCDRLGCAFVAPLWGADPHELAVAMIEGGLEIAFVEVAAPGFDESWLGRRLDRDALEDLTALHREYGVHLLGEGGEYQTIVTDGPHMSRPVVIEYEREWYGSWGQVQITDARLDGPTSETDNRDTENES